MHMQENTPRNTSGPAPDPAHQFVAAQTVARTVAHLGWRIADLIDNQQLIAAVRSLSTSAGDEHLSPVDLLIGFEPVLREAIELLGTNSRSHAAQLLIGLHSDTCGLLRKHRRPAAARAMDLVDETFIKHHESSVVEDLAVAIYRLARFSEDDGVS